MVPQETDRPLQIILIYLLIEIDRLDPNVRMVQYLHRKMFREVLVYKEFQFLCGCEDAQEVTSFWADRDPNMVVTHQIGPRDGPAGLNMDPFVKIQDHPDQWKDTVQLCKWLTSRETNMVLTALAEEFLVGRVFMYAKIRVAVEGSAVVGTAGPGRCTTCKEGPAVCACR